MLIMVVDDGPETTTTLNKTLMKKGHRIVPASTGEEAIELAKIKEYDILFMDFLFLTPILKCR